MDSKIRVRFAPSPTGPFSIGNARTALFNWLFARRGGGDFLLRIEDTDKARSEKKFEEDIIYGLKWLGLNWEEEIVRQSERLKFYENYLRVLLDKDLAYFCFCSQEELELEREAQLSQGFAPKYSGKCRHLSKTEAAEKNKTAPSVIRFKIPEKKISWNDLIRGRVEFDVALIGDIVIAKNAREPLYNFAATVDDFEMKITHVIRGEDHLSNTPKQLLLQEALGFSHPHYAHLPLILGPDRKKLSKRFSESSLNDFKRDGFLSQAVLNFLVLLGWHPIRDREIISIEEMIREFDLKRVQKGGAVFNLQKITWLNAHYIKNTRTDELLTYLKPFIPPFWMQDEDFVKKVIGLEKTRMKKLDEFENFAGFFFILPDYPATMLTWRGSKETKNNLSEVLKIIEGIAAENFSRIEFEDKILRLAEARGRGEILWPLRVALSGQEASPGPIELLEVLGREESLKRINHAIEKITAD